MNWSKKHDDVLRDFAAAGLSFLSVANQLGLTRNQVAGRAHRLGVRFASSLEATRHHRVQGCIKSWKDPAVHERRRLAIRAGIKRYRDATSHD